MPDNPENENKDPALKPLVPLESALITYLGRDEGGTVYSRLQYMQPREQLTFVPRIMSCLVDRAPDLDPLYIGTLVYRFSLYESETTGAPPAQIMTKDGRERLAIRFRSYTESLVSETLIDENTKLLKPDQLAKYVQLGMNEYAQDPFVRSAREVYTLLKAEELNELAIATMCTAIALVDQLSRYGDATNTPQDPHAA